MSLRMLCLRLPRWPVQRLLRAGSELKDEALIIYRPAPRGGTVETCSARAAALGIRRAMPLAEALAVAGAAGEQAIDSARKGKPLPEKSSRAKLASRPPHIKGGARAEELSFPTLRLIEHNPMADRRALLRLARWAQRFAPRVGIDEGAEPDGLWLDVSGCERLYGDERTLAVQFLEAIDRLGFIGRVALSDSLASAWGLAHFGPLVPWQPGDLPDAAAQQLPAAAVTPAASTTTLEMPGWLVVPPGEGSAWLGTLPLAALRLPGAAQEALSALGIERVEQLRGLPRRALMSRLGPEVLRRLDQATGHRPEPLEAAPATAPLEARWSGEAPLTSVAQVEAVLGLLLSELARHLAERQQAAQELRCRLAGPAAPLEFTLRLYRPTASERHLGQLLAARLESLHLPGPIESIALAVTLAAQARARQQVLFTTDEAAEAGGAVSELIDRLSLRLGSEEVLCPELRWDAQAEFACRWRAAVDVPRPTAASRRGRKSARRAANRPLASRQDLPPSGEANSASNDARIEKAWRPVRLAPRPLAIEVWAVAPSGPPARMRWRKRECELLQAWGPERIETGWWRGASVGRDYYQVETATGERLWIFRRLRDGQWFLHGWFE